MLLIVGHTGFLGSHIYSRFPNSYCQNSSGLYFDNQILPLTPQDLICSRKVSSVIYCAVKYHSASHSDLDYLNTEYPISLLNLCHSNGIKFIYFGSFFEKLPGDHMARYISTKLSFLSYMQTLSYSKSHYLRLEHIYGVNDKPAKFIPRIVSSILNNQDIVLNNPYHVRDFTPVDFVVNIVSQFIDGEIDDPYFEVGTGITQTTLDFVRKLIQVYTQSMHEKVDQTSSNILIEPKPSSVIPSSHARQHSIFKKFPISYFKNLEISAMNSLFNYD